MSEIIYYKPGPNFSPSKLIPLVSAGVLKSIPALKIPEVEGLTLIKDLNQKIRDLWDELFKAHAALLEANPYVGRCIGEGTPEESQAALELRQRIDKILKPKL